MHIVVVGKYALAVHSTLHDISISLHDFLVPMHTSVEHFPTAEASLSIGRVRPGMMDDVCRCKYLDAVNEQPLTDVTHGCLGDESWR